MAFDAILVLPGIVGECKDKKYKKDGDAGVDGGIDIENFSWGMTQSGSGARGGGSIVSSANFQDLTVTKVLDTATTAIVQAAASGRVIAPNEAETGTLDPKSIEPAKLLIRKASGGKAEDDPIEYLVYIMENVIISSYSTGGGGDSPLLETISLNFDKMYIQYSEQAKTGDDLATTECFWNMEKNSGDPAA